MLGEAAEFARAGQKKAGAGARRTQLPSRLPPETPTGAEFDSVGANSGPKGQPAQIFSARADPQGVQNPALLPQGDVAWPRPRGASCRANT